MSAKTKIVVVKMKDILFYATVVLLFIIVLLLLYILFQPNTAPVSHTIQANTSFIRDYNPIMHI